MTNSGSLLRLVRQFVPLGDDTAPDGQLLQRFASERDEQAFTALVKRHGPMVLGVCRRVLHHAHDAEDAFQATFLVLARKAGSIRRPESLGNWLYGVAYRTALEARTKVARRRRRERELAEDPPVDPTPDLVWRDLRAVLDCEVNRLPDKYRCAFVLCCLEDRTDDEAAHILGCPKGTVLSRLAWARQRLRSRLTRRGVTLSVVGTSALFGGRSLSAAVSAELVHSTTCAARLFVGGPAGPAVTAVMLARSVLRALFLDKLKVACVALLSVAVLGGGLSRLGQPTAASDRREPGNAVEHANAEGQLATLLALEKRGWEATRKKDVGSLRQLWAEDFVAILSDGSRLTRDEFCLVLPFFEIERYSLSDVRLLSLGPDAALLTYTVESETTILGEPQKGPGRIASTWVRRNGEWRNLFYQETAIAE
jgi:RNA polymerase sigma factor (sigma-70 family)